MKPGTRALGVAVSASGRRGDDRPARATVAAAVVRADRVVDGLSFSTCTVGGTDATDAVVAAVERLDRADVRHVLLAGVAPAWFNLIDVGRVRDAADRPVVAVSFEASDGLGPHLREHFTGDALARRRAVYEALPERVPLRLDGSRSEGDAADATAAGGDSASDGEEPDDVDLWIRAVGVAEKEARRIVRAHTPEGRRTPEPLRVAKLAARAGRSYVDRAGDADGECGRPAADRTAGRDARDAGDE